MFTFGRTCAKINHENEKFFVRILSFSLHMYLQMLSYASLFSQTSVCCPHKHQVPCTGWMFQHGQLGLGNKEDRPVPVHVGVEAVSHTHMYTPAHTPTHTHTNTLIHTHTLSYSQTYTLTLTHTHRYRSTHTYTRTRTHKRFIRPSLECGNTTRSICLVRRLFQTQVPECLSISTRCLHLESQPYSRFHMQLWTVCGQMQSQNVVRTWYAVMASTGNIHSNMRK